MSPELHAAGGVVWREVAGVVEIALVHRPRHRDWSLPKGGLRRDETAVLAAVREVAEETGARVQVLNRLGTSQYAVGSRRKTVEFFSMRLTGGDGGVLQAGDEVDEMCWTRLVDAGTLMTYDTERAVVQRFAASVRPDATVLLVRHARAGKRSEWSGDDRLRPLDKPGRIQARLIATLAQAFAPTELRAADRVRCEQTLEPLSRTVGLPVHSDPRFSDEAVVGDVEAARLALLSVAVPGAHTVICSQGGAIPALVERMSPGVADSTTRKGAFWVLCARGGIVVSADRYEDATRRFGQRR